MPHTRHGRSLGLLALFCSPVVLGVSGFNCASPVSINPAQELANDEVLQFDVSKVGDWVAIATRARNLVDLNGDGVFDDDPVKDQILVRSPSTDFEFVSVNDAGDLGNGSSGRPKLDNDGDVVAFESAATNLVPGDTNGERDIFVRSRTLETTIRVNVGTNGEQANGWSHSPHISGDGTEVLFSSTATNLTPEGIPGLFIRNLETEETTLVVPEEPDTDLSLSSRISSGRALSIDGRYVLYVNRWIGGGPLIRLDRHTGEKLVLGEHVDRATMSREGVYVLYSVRGAPDASLFRFDADFGTTVEVNPVCVGCRYQLYYDLQVSDNGNFVTALGRNAGIDVALANQLQPRDAFGFPSKMLAPNSNGSTLFYESNDNVFRVPMSEVF